MESNEKKAATPKREKVVKSPKYKVVKSFTYKGECYSVNSIFSGSVEDVAKVQKYLS